MAKKLVRGGKIFWQWFFEGGSVCGVTFSSRGTLHGRTSASAVESSLALPGCPGGGLRWLRGLLE